LCFTLQQCLDWYPDTAIGTVFAAALANGNTALSTFDPRGAASVGPELLGMPMTSFCYANLASLNSAARAQFAVFYFLLLAHCVLNIYFLFFAKDDFPN
jgi:hypothetical protein